MVLVCCHEGCNRLFATGGSMRKHHEKDHGFKGRRLPSIWHIVAAQQIDKGKHSQYFRVKVPSHLSRPSLDKDWITKLELEIDQVTGYPGFDPSDIRNVDAFLVQLGWPEHVQGLNPTELRSLVKPPTRDEFPMLKETVTWIFDVAVATIKYTPDSIRKQLKSKNLM